jgi:RNA polymerase sigma-70 factor (ECF subfamily)
LTTNRALKSHGVFRGQLELLAAFRSGQRHALEAVYWEYIDAVEKLAKRELLCMLPRSARQDLPDLVQEIFVRAFSERARLGYDGLREYGPYLLTIARNTIVDWARRRGREVPRNEPPEESVMEEPPFADDATLRVVQAYLATLSPELAAVHEQRYVFARSQAETAAALGISRQQLRTKEKRLRDGLAQALSAAGIDKDRL